MPRTLSSLLKVGRYSGFDHSSTPLGQLLHWLDPPRVKIQLKSFKNGPTQTSFSFIFSVFNQTFQFYHKSMWKMSIQSTSNSQPSDYESPPLTTRPALNSSKILLVTYLVRRLKVAVPTNELAKVQNIKTMRKDLAAKKSWLMTAIRWRRRRRQR